MREIKFRAWDEKNQRYILPPHSVSSFIGSNFFTLDGRCYIEGREQGLLLEQFTGLHDKEGREVYEGDLLRLPPEREWQGKNFSAFEVFYHDNDSTPTDCGLVLGRMRNYGSIAGGYCGYKLIPRDVGRMIVIGNIHSNPELLETEEI